MSSGSTLEAESDLSKALLRALCSGCWLDWGKLSEVALEEERDLGRRDSVSR